MSEVKWFFREGKSYSAESGWAGYENVATVKRICTLRSARLNRIDPKYVRPQYRNLLRSGERPGTLAVKQTIFCRFTVFLIENYANAGVKLISESRVFIQIHLLYGFISYVTEL